MPFKYNPQLPSLSDFMYYIAAVPAFIVPQVSRLIHYVYVGLTCIGKQLLPLSDVSYSFYTRLVDFVFLQIMSQKLELCCWLVVIIKT